MAKKEFSHEYVSKYQDKHNILLKKPFEEKKIIINFRFFYLIF